MSKTGKQVSQVQFYQIVECLKKNKEMFITTRPTRQKAAQQLTELLGFPVSINAIVNAQKVSNITWRIKPKDKKPSIKLSSLATAVHMLYEKLNEAPPDEFLFHFPKKQSS